MLSVCNLKFVLVRDAIYCVIVFRIGNRVNMCPGQFRYECMSMLAAVMGMRSVVPFSSNPIDFMGVGHCVVVRMGSVKFCCKRMVMWIVLKSGSTASVFPGLRGVVISSYKNWNRQCPSRSHQSFGKVVFVRNVIC